MADLDPSLLARIEAIEADLAIRSLVARYAFVMDDRDVDAIPALFTTNAKVTTGDGVMNSQGRDELVKLYEGRFAKLGATNHVVHGMDVTIDGPTTAHATVSSTAEVQRNGVHQVVALRYHDTYEKEDGAWRIATRHMLYFYYVPLDQYPGILGTLKRNLTYAEPMDADFPEKTPGFVKYIATH
ncbi:MAG: nuclear transport factor 2 family protein [Sphingomonas bacterium]|uniref:nuclear transport factor 2 family protein n=1 Tax=Sphingomonas bacterium TaxID=1895847 RepID=UPI002621E94A|nr:nuclear transport factor 2 family protein [Sphingomonas bacterium]MDB5703824.1 nuclear transport factor 2 family protein [Sphingomonas bacterium]